MQFMLDPPSGYADSYFDVQFVVQLDRSDSVTLRLFNETVGDQLEIIGVNTGRIIDGKDIHVDGAHRISGHFNVFNQDKMNVGFHPYNSVKIRCEAYFKNDEATEQSIVEFYNESHSLDSGIIPVDVTFNKNINIGNHEPLKIEIISTITKKYEFSIKSDDASIQCFFEVYAKKGRTSVELPAEVMFYDLELKKNHKKKFRLYFTKFEGMNFSRVANRKQIPVNDGEIRFVLPEELIPLPQKRLDPTGRIIDENFALSDRYFVLCPSQFSGLSAKNTYSISKLRDLTLLSNESQHMDAVNHKIQQFADGSDHSLKIASTQKMIENKKRKVVRPQVSQARMQLLSATAHSHAINPISPKKISQKAIEVFQSEQPKKECLPCSRKNKNAHTS